MKPNQEIMNQTMKMIANQMMKQDSDDWPPRCPCAFYQPDRPQRKWMASSDNNSDTQPLGD